MPSELPEIKAGQVWVKGKTRRTVRVNDGILVTWGSSERAASSYDWLKTFQRWASTATLVKEEADGR